MSTVADLIQDALLELGILDPVETLSAQEANIALRWLNRMIGQWNSEGLMIYTVDRQVFSLTVGQQSYTMGPGGNFNVARPVFVKMASVQNPALTQPVEIALQILTDEEWRGMAVKNTPGTFPTCMWANGNVPLNTLYFWPIPQSVYEVVLYTWGQTSAFSAVTDTVVFPPGYEEAIVTNLAVRLASGYSKQPSPDLVNRAMQAKALIESFNLEPLFTSADSALLSRGGNSIATRSFGIVVDRT